GFTNISSGTVEFTHDPLLVYNAVTSVNPNYTITNTTTGFTVDFVNLQPGDVEYIDISITCPVTVALDDIVTNTATYLTDTNDLVASNNYSTLSEVVVGSWDPNDKMESHGPKVLYDEFSTSDEWLYYTIRFQNLGTAEAIFVRIDDELDASLDETSFQMLRSSHDYVVTRTENSLEWFFEDINLPAEQDDAEGSNGFVYFRIKPQAGYGIGDIIPNTAAIYFDFNAPVITNRFETEFVEELLSVSEFDFNGFELYPNPANNLLNIKLNNITNAKLSIYDIQGKLVFKNSISEQELELNVSDLQSGLYFVKLNTDTKEFVKKLIIE
ncbi:T9SS type A sorting domain-containing protein, partial [Psychroserpens sp.]|uniref:T9SS type A sorting domain-containing protein n=1 Tax=Psychroserpens sp. TaxID=2020870 RepID=UPI003859DE74